MDLCDVRDVKLRQLVDRLPQIIQSSREKSTITVYNYAFKRFKTWAQHFIELTYLPASSKSIALYIMNLLQSSKSHVVIKQALCSISWFHRMSGLVDNTKSDIVLIVAEGAKRLSAEPIKKKEPMSPDILMALRNSCLRPDGSMNLLDQRNITFCILAYAGFFRFSEVSKIRRHHISFHDVYMTVYIPSSKTDVYHQGKNCLIAKTNSELCPVTHVAHYLAMANIDSDAECYIFRAVSFCKSIDMYRLRSADSPLCYSTVRDMFRDLLSKVGLDSSKFGLHSLRAGGATAAASSGVSDRIFKRHGRWKSELAKDGYVKAPLAVMLAVTLNIGL